MTDKTREVYAEKVEPIPELNPFVDMPRMRVDAVNRLNELIQRDNAMAIVKKSHDVMGHTWYECPVCGKTIYNTEGDNFCRICGQRLDTENIAL